MTSPTAGPVPAAGAAMDRRAASALAGIGTALPPRRMTQAESLAYILGRFPGRESTKSLYRRVMAHPSVQTRHFCLDDLDEVLETDPDRVQDRYRRWAVRLGAEALAASLADAGLGPADLGLVVTTTCTGSLCPGLSAHLTDAAGLPAGIAAADLAGMGCGAALPALRAAADFTATRPGSAAAVVCVEICSAAMFADDDPQLVISNSIFSDGAAAVILVNGDAPPTAAAPAPATRIGPFASHTVAAWRDSLRFTLEGGRLRNVLGRETAPRSAVALGVAVDRLLAATGLTRAGIDRWVFHAGGATVLDAIRDGLSLPESSLAAARSVLARCGNMSSPTVLFVLAEEMAARPPRAGERAILASFGAGFSAHAALLEFG